MEPVVIVADATARGRDTTLPPELLAACASALAPTIGPSTANLPNLAALHAKVSNYSTFVSPVRGYVAASV